MSKSKHVIPNSKGGWTVRSSGATKATRIFSSESEAVSFARKAAIAANSELYIHKKDGTILQKSSYGSSISQPKV